MFQPNVNCRVTPMIGHDVYGGSLEGSSFDTRCGVVRLEAIASPGNGPSGGHAWDDSAIARLLFKAPTRLMRGDKVSILGMDLMVLTVFPRHAINGTLDHYQVDCRVWPSS